MVERDARFELNSPATYRIKVQGRLDKSWSAWFGDMTIAAEQSEGRTTVTTLTGTVGDQSALHGLLACVRDLGLPLLLVERVSSRPGEHNEP